MKRGKPPGKSLIDNSRDVALMKSRAAKPQAWQLRNTTQFAQQWQTEFCIEQETPDFLPLYEQTGS
jgi:hypothetical protein